MDSKPPDKPSKPIDIPMRPRREVKDDEDSESSSPGKWIRKSVGKDSQTETSFTSDPFETDGSGFDRRRLQTMQPTASGSPLYSSGGSSERAKRHFSMATGFVDESMRAYVDEGFMEELSKKLGAVNNESFKEDMAKRMTFFFEDDDIPFDDDGYESVSAPSSLQEERTVTNRRMEEMVIAALLQKKPDALAEAIGNPRHDPIEVDICYKLLLSPDKLRPNLIEHEKNDPELIWCEKVRESVKQIRERGTRIISVRDRSGEQHRILVKPRIHLFIDPCSNMAFTKLGAMTGTWELADEVNRETLTELMGSMEPDADIGGEVAELLRKDSTPPEIKQELVEVVRYIRFMYEKDRHHRLTKDPFYTSNLTSKLCRLLDFANVIGCKSAKDRTGLKSAMDIKFCIDCFMARARWLRNGKRGSITPKPGQPVTFAEIFNACQLILNSGQMENQLKNTGIPGFKVPGYMLGIAMAVYTLINRGVSAQTAWLK